jgi:23S rRNA (cytidine1920-2'-O)/16S rRNA (cytidine1409-2'-O)-methyltransferase
VKAGEQAGIFFQGIIMSAERLDIVLFERGIVESRSLAQRLVMEGKVRVNGQMVIKPSVKIKQEDVLTLEAEPPFVSRGGEKLQTAIEAFQIQPQGWICADVGASTGGFTDCLLQHGAAKVYAIDVGYGVLHWKMRNDPRVVSMERTNARFLESLPEPVRLITIDASFISLEILLPAVQTWFGPGGGEVVALIKPQFEAGVKEVSKGEGVITDPKIHQQVVDKVKAYALAIGYKVKGLITSPLKGPKGNTEFLIWLEYQPE